MGAHVAHLADAEVAIHVPEEAVQAVGAAEILRAVGVIGRRADPLFVVQETWRMPLRLRIPGARQLAAVPAVDGLQFADRRRRGSARACVRSSGRRGAACRAASRALLFLLQVVRAHGADLFHGDAERLLAVDVHVAIERPVGDEGMMVVGGADDHGLDVLLVEHLAPVPIGLCLREDLERFLGAEVVDVAERDDVLVPEDVVVRGAPAPYADQGDVQLVAGGVLSAAACRSSESSVRRPRSRISADHVFAFGYSFG